jgi:hypothetical protein
LSQIEPVVTLPGCPVGSTFYSKDKPSENLLLSVSAVLLLQEEQQGAPTGTCWGAVLGVGVLLCRLPRRMENTRLLCHPLLKLLIILGQLMFRRKEGEGVKKSRCTSFSLCWGEEKWKDPWGMGKVSPLDAQA